jgi:alanyl-tRNA synthetase
VTLRLYREDPYLLEFDARVLERVEHAGRPAVVLDRTAFYAESGGQPWDTGTLQGVPVTAVVEDGERVVHVLAAPLAGDAVRGRVDGARRRDHRQQHHGQHLLSRALEELHRARTVGFHLGVAECSIDLDREIGAGQARAAEALANRVIWEARPVSVRRVTRAEAEALGVRVPEQAGDAVRLVEAAGFDVQPCGGTHPRNTAEVGCVVVLGQERYKGGSRVRFVCGDRALATLHALLDVLDRAAGLLSSAPQDVALAVERLEARLADAEHRAKDLLDRALDGEARRLLGEAAGAPPVVVAAYDGRDPAELRLLAAKLLALAPCVALLGSRAGKAHVVFAQSEGLPHDVPALLQEAASALGGRGGGRGNLAQGGGDRVERLDAVLAAAAARVRERG